MAIFRQTKFLSFWAGILIVLVYFHLHGFVFNFSDETFILFPAARVVDGGVLYRDIVVTYTPGAIWAVALFYRLMGISVLSGRVLMIIMSMTGAIGVFKLTSKVTRKTAAPFLAVLIYLSWGPLMINWPAPGMFALVSGIWVCLFLTERRYLWAGILTALTFLFKQNFGVAILITSFFYFRGRITRRYALGVLILMLGAAIYMLMTGSWNPFIEVFNTYVINKFVASGYASTPIRSIFYLGPLIAAGWFLVVIRKETKWWFLAVFVATYFLFGIRPVADYVHLVPLIAVSGILLAVINYPVSIILIISGLYLSLFGNYYRWGPPIISENFFDNDQRGNVFTTSQIVQDRNNVIAAVRRWSKGKEEIFVDSYSPWIYFFSNRNNASRFIFIASDSLTDRWAKEIESTLENKKVGLVVTSSGNEQDSFYLIKYIKTKYHPVEKIEGFQLWRRNET